MDAGESIAFPHDVLASSEYGFANAIIGLVGHAEYVFALGIEFDEK